MISRQTLRTRELPTHKYVYVFDKIDAMSRANWGKRILAVFGVTLVVLRSTYIYLISPHHSSASPESAEGLLDRADTLAWGNRWADAQPLYGKAQYLFDAQKERSKALYAEVSQVPPDESGSGSEQNLQLTQDLGSPEAQEAETRLRILTSGECWRRITTRDTPGLHERQ